MDSAKKRKKNETPEVGLHEVTLVVKLSMLFDDVTNANCKDADVTIIAGNKTFYCHKLVLRFKSTYFEKYSFDSKPVILLDTDPNDFHEVLKYMYTGEKDLNCNNIKSLLTIADDLGISDLKRLSFDFLETTCMTDNKLLCMELAKKYCLTALVEKCRTEIINEFKKLNSDSSLLNTSEEKMTIFLSADSLDVKSEVEVCKVLMKWLEVKTKAGRKVHPDQLLPLIRWSGISVDYFIYMLLLSPTLTSDRSSFIFLNKVTTYLLFGVQFEGLKTFHRASNGLENCLMIVGLWNSTNKLSNDAHQIGLQYPNRVRKLAKLPPGTVSKDAVACLVNNSCLYLVGTGHTGGVCCKSVFRWDTVAGWFKCPDMPINRQLHSAVAVDSMLYVLGGHSSVHGSPLIDVDCYNTKTNKWSSAGELTIAVESATCVAYKDCIYMFGGVDKHKNIVDHVQVYNPLHESCTKMDVRMPCPHSGMRAVVWETSVILLDSDMCYIYNFEGKTWKKRMDFKSDVEDFALVLDNSTLYIAGGRLNENTDGSDEEEKKGGKAEDTSIDPEKEEEEEEDEKEKEADEEEEEKEENEEDEEDESSSSTYTDKIRSMSVLNIIKNEPAVWKDHAKLPKPGSINAFVSISLPIA